MYNLTDLFLLALVGSLFGLIGGVFFLFSKKSAFFLQKHSVPFAAGVLITVALLALIPEAYEQIGETALLIVLLSFLAAFLLEHFILDIHHHEHDHHSGMHGKKPSKASIVLIVLGDTIHNFIDGVAIATSYFIAPPLGLVTTFSTVLHEVPHEIGDFAILLKAGYKRKNVLFINIFSSLFTVVGAFFTLFFIDNTFFLGAMLAISAGIFIYLGTIDFLPNIRYGYDSKIKSVLPLIIGVTIMAAILLLMPDFH
jgi:zinc and cadmium transporter